MPYEYEVHAHSVKNMLGKQELQDWLNEKGAEDWRLVCFYPDIEIPIIFERKIEINDALRNSQLGIKPEKKENQDDDNDKIK